MKVAKVTFAGLMMVGAVSLSACTSNAAQNTTAPAISVSSAPAATSTAPATTPPPAAPVTRSYDAARTQWKAGATAISAEQGKYWSQAADDLTLGTTTDTDPTGYADAVARLKELVSLPDAQQTAEQNARYHADINTLNAFFKTPGLYS